VIQGAYIDPRIRNVTAHAVQRFAERHSAAGDVNAAIAQSVKRAKPLYDHQRWWLVTSYWINEADRLLFVFKPEDGALKVITVMRADSEYSLGNPLAAKALREWRKAKGIRVRVTH